MKHAAVEQQPMLDVPLVDTHTTEAKAARPAFSVTRVELIREVTDEAQGLTLGGPFKLNKHEWFWLSAILFAVPFLYGSVYQVVVPLSQSSVYFDGCYVSDQFSGECNASEGSDCYQLGEVLNFSQCLACNGVGNSPATVNNTNLVSIEKQQQGQLGFRMAAAGFTSLVGMLLFSLRVRYCRYARRSLALLAYGVYTVPQPAGKAKKALSATVMMLALLVLCYIQLQLIGGATLDRVHLHNEVLEYSGGPFGVCNTYNSSGDVSFTYIVRATFLPDNPSVASFGTPTPSWSELGTWVIAALALYVPVVYAVLNQYLTPYAALGLSDILDGSKGVSRVVGEHIRFHMELEGMCKAIIRHMATNGVNVELTCLQQVVRLSGKRPAEEFMCDLWGDDEASVEAVLLQCGDALTVVRA